MIETSGQYKVAIIGNGWVGKAYAKMFPDAVIYDEPQLTERWKAQNGGLPDLNVYLESWRRQVNQCDLALVCVPTNPIHTEMFGDQLDMSIVTEVVAWLDTPLILIKSALQPGTVDKLVKQLDKKIAVSVEMVGEGRYFVPYWKYPDAEDPTKHSFLIIGGEDETARRCADFLWAKMSPDINIHLTTAIKAEICKLMENTWGAQKVTFANVMYDICEKLGANYTRVLQAWGSDGRTEKMHMRVLPNKRGWKSKCYSKDIPALAGIDSSGFLSALIETNEKHLDENQK